MPEREENLQVRCCFWRSYFFINLMNNFTHLLVLFSLIPSFILQVYSVEHWYPLYTRMPWGKRAAVGVRAVWGFPEWWGLSDGTLTSIKLRLWGRCTSKPSTAILTIEKCTVFPSFRNSAHLSFYPCVLFSASSPSCLSVFDISVIITVILGIHSSTGVYVKLNLTSDVIRYLRARSSVGAIANTMRSSRPWEIQSQTHEDPVLGTAFWIESAYLWLEDNDAIVE